MWTVTNHDMSLCRCLDSCRNCGWMVRLYRLNQIPFLLSHGLVSFVWAQKLSLAFPQNFIFGNILVAGGFCSVEEWLLSTSHSSVFLVLLSFELFKGRFTAITEHSSLMLHPLSANFFYWFFFPVNLFVGVPSAHLIHHLFSSFLS